MEGNRQEKYGLGSFVSFLKKKTATGSGRFSCKLILYFLLVLLINLLRFSLPFYI